jgi:hypothetical protein
MKTLILAAIRCSLLFLLPAGVYAISTQWDLDPISGDWNTADNWTPNEVPNGPADTATFALSNTTDVSISTNTEVNGINFTPTATNPYTITVSSGLTLTISGTGIVNESGRFQNFVIDEGGEIVFSNRATAGSNVDIVNNGGTTNFFNSSSAGNAGFDTQAANVFFHDNSTAGSASILNFGESHFEFFDHSTAGNATFLIGEGFFPFPTLPEVAQRGLF